MNEYLKEIEKVRREMDENGLGDDNDGIDMQAAFYLIVSIVSACVLVAGFFLGRLSCVI